MFHDFRVLRNKTVHNKLTLDYDDEKELKKMIDIYEFSIKKIKEWEKNKTIERLIKE